MNLKTNDKNRAKMVSDKITLQYPERIIPGRKSKEIFSLLMSNVTKLRNTTTKRIGIK
jgi:hypothetical protein